MYTASIVIIPQVQKTVNYFSKRPENDIAETKMTGLPDRIRPEIRVFYRDIIL